MWVNLNSLKLSSCLYIVFWASYACGNEKKNVITEFSHESCQNETLTEFAFKNFYSTESFYSENGVLELLVRFKGVADGHILLTQNSSSKEPLYMIILGSYNNKKSEIRRTKKEEAQFKINTPGILSREEFRGFLIRYNRNNGGIWVYPEGGDMPLLHWTDPEPLPVNYFSFATYHRRRIQVAFNCHAKDDHSIVTRHKGQMY